MRMLRTLSVLAVIFPAILSTGACGSSIATDAGEALPISVTGRLERGAQIRLTYTGGNKGDRHLETEWGAEPAELVEFTGPGEVKLLEEGRVEFTARRGESADTLEVEILVPPTLVFELLRDGARDIYRATLDGRDLVRLTSGVDDNREPTVVGDRVVFVSYRHGNGELFSVPLAGGAETRLTRTAHHESEPALSRDGERLAFISTASGVPKLWLSRSDGSEPYRAAPDFGFAGSIEASPSWSPRGDRVVFVSTTQGTADLFIYSRSDGSVKQLISTPAPEVEPAWSADGQWVAFASSRNGQTDIYRARVSNGATEQLTDREETDARPAWTADGRIVYVARVGSATRLRWLDPDDPGQIHEVPIGDGTLGRVAAVW